MAYVGALLHPYRYLPGPKSRYGRAGMWKHAHDFLKWLPFALTGSAIGISAVWEDVKNAISEVTYWALSQMTNVWALAAAALFVALYLAAIVWTGKKAETPPRVSEQLEYDRLKMERRVNARLEADSAKNRIVNFFVFLELFKMERDQQQQKRLEPPNDPA